MDEFSIRIVKSPERKATGRGKWIAQVNVADDHGYCHGGDTPQEALAGLAVYWAVQEASGTSVRLANVENS